MGGTTTLYPSAAPLTGLRTAGLTILKVRFLSGSRSNPPDRVPHPVRVELVVARDGHRLVIHDRVAVAGDHRVDAQAEEVLVETPQDSRVHDGAERVRRMGERGIDRLRRQDPRRPHLVGHIPRRVEDEGQDILVIADRDDGLQDQLSVPDDDGAVCPVVCVLPQDAGFLLVHAYHVGHVDWLPVAVGQDPVDVLDAAEAVAAKLEVVGHDAGAYVAKVEYRLAVERVPRVCVGNHHLRQAQPEEERLVVVVHVVDHYALPLVEANLEVSLLLPNQAA